MKKLNEAVIDESKAETMIQQTLKDQPPGQKRTFVLKQILTAMMKGMQKKQSIMRANALILKYNLDQTDKIPLFRI